MSGIENERCLVREGGGLENLKAAWPAEGGEGVLDDIETEVMASGEEAFTGEGGIYLLVLTGKGDVVADEGAVYEGCLLYTSPSPRDRG